MYLQCSQDIEVGENKEGKVWQHEVNCCCVLKVCNKCANDDNTPCNNCGERKKTFLGTNALNDFCTWLFSERNKGSYALAHNCRGWFL